MTTCYKCLADRNESLIGRMDWWSVVETHGGWRRGEMESLMRGGEANQSIALVEGYGEVLHGNGAEVGDGEGGVDFNEGLVERVGAEMDCFGKAAGFELEARGEREGVAEADRIGGEAHVGGERFGKAEAGAAGVDEGINAGEVADVEGDERDAVGFAEG